METVINTSEKQDSDKMAETIKKLPEQAQQYIRGCS